MNSIAVWSDKNQSLKIHLDLNLWITKQEENYIEFGLKLLEKGVTKLNIYIPFKITKDNFEDKVKQLSEKSTLVNAMFNKKLSVGNLDGRFCEVKENDEIAFCLCEILDSDIDFQIQDNGTIITIDVNNSNTGCEKLYYRFRINKLENIFDNINTNWIFTNGVKENINFIEVSLNSVRKLPSGIVDNIKDVKISSMNIFIITENFVDIVFHSKRIHKSRVLEKLWKEYVNIADSNHIQKLVAYHWKSENGSFVDYNLFTKVSYAIKDKRLLFGMLFFILLIGAIGGVFGNFLTTYLMTVPKDIDKSIKSGHKGENNVTISKQTK